ncbi:MAG: Na+/H+ antiporter subunit E [Peptococcaceae bacterium]|nr:Na+/H+ antiporter subunit E [Peptococcaceae bacterium]MBQ2015105.1 Na+/H+ antiporter subunit E [Peptococcaceae bacterium]MBQ2035545.1 Na+/H+ antiporter subunit E [Peptococcaceae bacterium]MBQ2448700.1 Na+/H+ antiporter subunit E [Peptococcaceae bacterium]MBQ5653042.1 Na+/H+ antiporter subunit E [Peptococcaceae bacterium]
MKTKDMLNDKTIVGSPMKHLTVLAVVLFAFWFLLSGKVDFKFLLYGALTAIISAWICVPLLLLPNADGTKKYFIFDVNLGKYAVYWLWLLKEVVNANIDVVKATVKSEMVINPRVIAFRIKYDNPMAHTTLANSITLTPGTVTLNVTEDGLYEIHALTDGAAEGLLGGGMQQKVADLFGEPFIYEVVEGGEVQ